MGKTSVDVSPGRLRVYQKLMKPKSKTAIHGPALCAVFTPAAQARELDRSTLPIPQPKTKPISTPDARDATAPPRFEVKAPQGAPNVFVVLIDDIGFSTDAFGKYRGTPPSVRSVPRPMDRWPTGPGFDRFHGFIGGRPTSPSTTSQGRRAPSSASASRSPSSRRSGPKQPLFL